MANKNGGRESGLRVSLRSILLIRAAELCTATLEMVVAFLDDREGLDVVPGQVYEVQVCLIEKIILEGPCAHPFEEIQPHLAHKNQGFVVDLLYLGELPGVKEFENGSDAARRNHKGIRKVHEAVEPFREALKLPLDIKMGGKTLFLWKRYVETDGTDGRILFPFIETVTRCLHQARSTSRDKINFRRGYETGQIEDLVILRAILFQSCRSEDGNTKLIIVQFLFEFVHGGSKTSVFWFIRCP